ncbi:hypothetical protein M5D96_008836, partial [Drosophila gunungcola]
KPHHFQSVFGHLAGLRGELTGFRCGGGHFGQGQYGSAPAATRIRCQHTALPQTIPAEGRCHGLRAVQQFSRQQEVSAGVQGQTTTL